MNAPSRDVEIGVDAAVEHHEADLGEVRLHYVSAGPLDGEPIVLLHGFPEFWYSWRHQITAFSQAGFRVYAVDQRGYNTSSKPPHVDDYLVTTLADDVARFLDHIGAPTATIVGHDWGGFVAWIVAGRHRERVRRLAVLNMPHPIRMQQGLRTPRQLRKSWYIGFFQIPLLPEKVLSARDFAQLRKALGETSRPGAFSGADIERYVEAFRHEGALTGALNWYRAAPRARGRDARQRIDAQTLVIWGINDHALGQELADPPSELVPNARVERLEDAGHWVQNDAPERVNRLLLNFVAET